jgi:hypothetical protein
MICYKFGRRIEIPDGYRMLEESEILREGDQYLTITKEWKEVERWGMSTTNSFNIFIRKIEHA